MEQQLKERLVGVVVLVCAAVIVIPMVLSGNRDPAAPDAPPARAEPPPERGFSSRVVPLEPVERRTPPAPPPAPEPRQPSEEAPPPAPRESPPAPAPPPPVERAPEPVQRAPAEDGDWVVQLGSFATARNARALRDRLRAGGYSAYTETRTHEGTEVTRVYVGPQASRERAEATVSRLLEETRLKGIVLRNGDR